MLRYVETKYVWGIEFLEEIKNQRTYCERRLKDINEHLRLFCGRGIITEYSLGSIMDLAILWRNSRKGHNHWRGIKRSLMAGTAATKGVNELGLPV
jgi:hypothetical protein